MGSRPMSGPAAAVITLGRARAYDLTRGYRLSWSESGASPVSTLIQPCRRSYVDDWSVSVPVTTARGKHCFL
jgi:hypothetical protein